MSFILLLFNSKTSKLINPDKALISLILLLLKCFGKCGDGLSDFDLPTDEHHWI